MILLDGHSLKQKRKLPLVSMQLTLKERESTASIVPADMSGIAIDSWMMDDTNPGKNIVWRVRSTSKAYNRDTTTVQLEHAINTLKDRILFGEHGPVEITGSKKAKTCTAKQAVQYILKQQGDWKLGAFGYTDANPYKFDGQSLFDALKTVTDSLKDAEWTYDMREYPFTIHITPYDTDPTSILRPGRNLKAITKTVDKSGMFTRFYPIGKDDLHLTGSGYVEKNTNKYGIVSKVETDAEITSRDELTRWANEQLEKWAQPTVTIDVDGLELSAATGESMDRLRLGQICMVPLAEFGETIKERITALSYSDKVRQPENVRVTLANNRTDVTKILAEEIKKAGKSGRSAAKKAKQDNAWFEDTNDHVAMCAKGIIGVDAQGNPNWYQLSQIVVDGTGIHQSVTEVQNGVETQRKRLDVDEKKIGMVVETKKGKNFIKAGEICLAINEDGSSDAKIEASKIRLLGETIANKITADYISTKIQSIGTLKTLTVKANGNISSTSAIMGQSFYVGTTGSYKNISDPLLEVRISGPSSNVYTLQYKSATHSSWTDAGDFSRAVTSWTMGWSGGKFTAKANPQNQSCNTTLVQGSTTWDGNAATVTVEAYDSDNPSYQYETGRTIYVDASTIYNNGKKAATVTISRGSVTTDSAYQKWLNFTATNDSNTGNKDTMKIYLVAASSGHKAQLRQNSASGTLIAEISTY